MGSYLSEPITEKISIEEVSEQLNCGASSMQGWRVSQEDAHNCILDYDKNTAFFAVFDGHGGHEVALYCSQKLPDFLKSLKSYKENDIEKALEEAFLGFDGTIATPEVVSILKEMAKDKEANEESDEDDENVENLCEEASMPIEQVIEKYTNNLLNPKNTKEDGKPYSPYLRSKNAKGEAVEACSSSGTAKASSIKAETCEVGSTTSGVGSSASSQSENGHKTTLANDEPSSTSVKSESTPSGELNSNGESTAVSNSIPTENGTPKKGKALTKTKGVSPAAQEEPTERRTRPKRSTVRQMYAKLLDINADEEDDDESEDENDRTFEGPAEISSDDDAENADSSLKEEDETSEDDEEDDEEEEEEEDDDDEKGDEDEAAAAEFARNMVEEPGSDSGCTAVVAVYREKKLYVANAGDSRCIVCRNGQAIDMSFDHKPEDQPERDRIVKAGGRVTADGRVNGGLNLSRAIGDHAYKQNKELSDREQMITALPDVKTLDIDTANDEFMVLACDGIWNFMSSQEVVDFIKPAIENGTKLSKICEEMFDHCLAPNTMGDGTGCDNMTAIIVQFKRTGDNLKRPASPGLEATDNTKRIKTDDEHAITTTSTTSST